MTDIIDSTVSMVENTLEMAQGTANEVPPIYLMIENKMRSGLSAIRPTSQIVSRMSEANIDTGKLPDGAEPNINPLARIIVEEVIKEIQLHGLIQAVIDPMAITVAGTSTTVPAVPFTATNILPVSVKGIMT